MMAESNELAVSETDIIALQEALYAQEQLLQQISTELDVEREASSTAANEALSMILRLQGEKASLRMEASQYKRMAEEKMCHAEEALAVFEDLICQREMEIASLEFQVHAYRYRLLSMGCNDLGVCEDKFPGDISMKRHDSLSGEKVLNINVKKLNSLPQIQGKKSTGERKILAILAPDSSTSIADENGIQEVNDLEKKSGGYAVGHINSYQKQIKKLDKWVKDISNCKDPGRHKANFSRGSIWSPSLFSQASAGNVLDSMREEDGDCGHSDQFKHLENYEEKEVIVNATCSPGVQDIIEVPQTIRICKSSEAPKMECQILNTKGENKLGSADLTSDEYFDSVKEAETDCIKAMVLSPGCQKRSQKPRDGMSIDCNVSVGHPDLAAVATQTDFGQLSQRIEQLERARTFNKQEIADVRDNELKLLTEINEQLKSIKSEMKTLKAETSPLPDRPTLDLLQEAMIYFWI